VAEDTSVVEQRLLKSATYIASDELEGRGVDTKGINLAADYIVAQFKEIGLKTEIIDGSPFQKFTMVTAVKPGQENSLAIVDPEGKAADLKLASDFNTLGAGGSGKFDLPLVFVGYSITAKNEQQGLDYDDFAGIDVKGKAVVMIRRQPQQGSSDSKFGNMRRSMHASFERKISNAYQHGAAAVIIVNDGFTIARTVDSLRKKWSETIDLMTAEATAFNALKAPTREEVAKHVESAEKRVKDLDQVRKDLAAAADPLIPFNGAGTNSRGRDVPVLTVTRAVMDKIVSAAMGKDLATIEAEIDKEVKPMSVELAGWKVRGQTSVDRVNSEVKNVIGVLPGEGPLAEETIVLGAHYDHLGYGTGGGALDAAVQGIRNGADDNGSGTVALIECARQLAASGPHKRTFVFIAFTAEERGLIGSEYYCEHPTIDLAKCVAMLNMDMVGRLNEEKLTIQGADTAKEFRPFIDEINKKYGFVINHQRGGTGPSDHTSFYVKKVPVMHFFTNTHPDYHRVTDDVEKLNIPGMRRVIEMVVETGAHIAGTEARPTYVQVAGGRGRFGGGGDRPYFGSIPAFEDAPGLKISGVTEEGPAAKAGLKAGDVIQQLGDLKIGNLEDFDGALRRFKAGDKVKVQVLRGDEKITVEVTLEPPR
jgi:hypothetical protein